MMKKALLIFTLIIFACLQANAKIDVVYPTTKEVTVTGDSMFFLGNTDYGAKLFINGNPVKLWENNFFVHVVPVTTGKNEIKFTSKHDGITEHATYYVKKHKAGAYTGKSSPYEEKNPDEYLYTTTIKNNATLRDKPSTASNRLTELQKDIVLYIKGKKGEYYRIDETGETEYWIHKSNVHHPEKVHQKIEPIITERKFYSDDNYNYAKFFLTMPVMYTIKQKDKTLELTLYGIKTKDDEGNIKDNYKYTFSTDRDILGYDCYYEEGALVVRMAKLPNNFDEKHPLKNIKIFVDAGHGGVEKGSVGPTRIPEKDINLSISKNLAEMLRAEGAEVITSRTSDIKVPLYDRVGMSKENNALISVSIHANALPNGSNPFVKHGTEVHYYNENAKLLSEIIKNNLVTDLNLKDNGIHRSSFALNRSTNPVSVLVEVAYMIYPEEYILLKDTNFQKAAAKSIKKSLENYLIMLKK